MKKALLLLCIAGAVAPTAHGQWSFSGTDIYNSNAGLVGIGGVPTDAKLDVRSSGIYTISAIESSTSGFTRAVFADVHSPSGAAVYGRGLATSGPSYGLVGTTSSTAGIAIFGHSTAGSGNGIGVWARTNGPNGIGLLAASASTTGWSGGLRADGSSNIGYGIWARAMSASGTPIAVYSEVVSSSGHSIYAIGGRNYFEGHVGIGTETPSAPLHTVGSVRLESLPTAAANANTRALTVDTNGNISAQAVALMNGTVEFRSAGSTSWAVPAGITRVKARLWGAGGGGCGGCFSQNTGGSGAYVEGVIDLTGISSLTVTVGAGGATTFPGSDSAILHGVTTLLRAGGGGAGTSSGNGTGGTPSPAAGGVRISAAGNPGLSVNDWTEPPYPGPQLQGTPPSSGGISLEYVSVGCGGRSFHAGMVGAVILEW